MEVEWRSRVAESRDGRHQLPHLAPREGGDGTYRVGLGVVASLCMGLFVGLLLVVHDLVPSASVAGVRTKSIGLFAITRLPPAGERSVRCERRASSREMSHGTVLSRKGECCA